MKPPPLPQRNKSQGACSRLASASQIQRGAISLNTKPPGKGPVVFLTCYERINHRRASQNRGRRLHMLNIYDL